MEMQKIIHFFATWVTSRIAHVHCTVY